MDDRRHSTFRRPSTRKQSTFRDESTQRQSGFKDKTAQRLSWSGCKDASTRRQSHFRDEPARSQPTFRDGSARRQLNFRDESIQREPTFRDESARRQSTFKDESAQRQSTFRDESFRRQSTFRDESARRQSTFRDESSRRRSTFRDESARRRSTFRDESARRRSTFRDESARRQSTFRDESARRQSTFRRPSSRKHITFRRLSTRRKSSYRPFSSETVEEEEEETASTNSEDYSDDSWYEDSSEESNHTLSATVKTYIKVEENGIGIILIQNGPYIQISGLVDNSAAVKDGKLQPGDVLRKIGHANVLGCTLRELRQLLHTTCVGTVLQIQVYRDFVPLPFRWENILENIPEKKGPEISTSSDDSEDWTSNEDSDDATVGGGDGHVSFGVKDGGDCNSHFIGNKDGGVRSRIFSTEKEQCGVGSGANSGHAGFVDKEDGNNESHTIFSNKDGGSSSHIFGVEKEQNGGDGGGSSHVVSGDVEDDAINAKTIITGASSRTTHRNAVLCEKVVHSSIFGPFKQPKWISKDWHIFERKTHTFTVGSDIGCDIMIHKGCNAERDSNISDIHLRSSSPYWTLSKYNIESSVPSSSSAISDVFWLESFSHELD